MQRYQILDLIGGLVQARRQKGLTQSALAERVGIPQSHLSNTERGKVDLRLSSLIEVARELDLEVVLVPRQYVPAVRAIVAGQGDEAGEYLYRLGPSGSAAGE
jgi:transcriptional regulator with XRE-family HTH domain